MKHKLTRYQMKIWIKNMGKECKGLPIPGKVLYLSFPNHIDPDKKFAAIRCKGKKSYLLSFTTERPAKKEKKPDKVIADTRKKDKKPKKENKVDRQTEGWIKVIKSKEAKSRSNKKSQKTPVTKAVKVNKASKKKGKRK